MFSHLQLNTVRAGALPYWHPVRVRETDPTSWASVGELGGEPIGDKEHLEVSSDTTKI